MPSQVGQGAGRIGSNAGKFYKLGVPAGATPCEVEVCDRPAWRSSLCRGHKARQDRGLEVDVPLRSYRRET